MTPQPLGTLGDGYKKVIGSLNKLDQTDSRQAFTDLNLEDRFSRLVR
jgi:hypothetical protein